MDPLKLGRCQVRIIGKHTEDKTILPTKDLPWAYPMQPIISAAMNGIGHTPLGPVEGTWVVVFFHDAEEQMPVMLGTIGGVPQSKVSADYIIGSDRISTDGGVVKDGGGRAVVNKDGTELTLSQGINAAASVISGFLGTDISGLINGTVANAVSGLVSGGTGGIFGSISNIVSSFIDGNSFALPIDNIADESKETAIPRIETGADRPLDAQMTGTDSQLSEPAQANPKVLAAGIPTEPPPKYSGDRTAARRNIAAIVQACDKVGLTHKYAKAAILGIVGGETAWQQVEEGHVYSNKDNMMKIFASGFKGNTGVAEQYVGGKKSKKDFFELVYGWKDANGDKNSKGIGLGNKSAGDGGKYYGRGFQQLTGRNNYERFDKLLKQYGFPHGIVANPEMLTNNLECAAGCCALFYKVNVTQSQDSPGYFAEALKKTGNPVGDSYKKKTIFYEYFLGEGVAVDSTSKSSTDEIKTYTKNEVSGYPPEKQMRLLEQRPENKTQGFCDPNGKYPLRNFLDEQDTNRLARSVYKETIVDFKDYNRTRKIPVANNNEFWEQPIAPWGGEYPYNKVFESEAGHVQMFDDTAGHETVSLTHRKGTFIDVDANGTQVNKIVGDGYTIIDRNGMVFIAGKCNITVGNSANIYVQGNADIEVNGTTTGVFHEEVNLNCAADVNWVIGGNFNLKVDKDFNTTVLQTKNTHVTRDINVESLQNIKTKSKLKTTFNALTEFEINTPKLRGTATDLMEFSADIYKLSANDMNISADLYKETVGTSFYRWNRDKYMFIGADTFTVPRPGTDWHCPTPRSGGLACPRVNSADKAVPTDGVNSFDPLKLVATEIRSGNTDTFEVLTTPVRPSPPVILKENIAAKINAAQEDFEKNPSKYYNPAADAAGVKPNQGPQPDVGDAGQSIVSGAEAGDIAGFLMKQVAKAKEGYWSETGMGGKPSNENILSMWKDIGLANVGKNDQVPWCAAFVNWVLKQCNYRYVQSARAFDIIERPERWKMTKVSPGDERPGDVIVWSYSHVSFVYELKGKGKFSCCGGNQGGKDTNNNPTGGLVTVNYTNGITAGSSTIRGIFRPSKE